MGLKGFCIEWISESKHRNKKVHSPLDIKAICAFLLHIQLTLSQTNIINCKDSRSIPKRMSEFTKHMSCNKLLDKSNQKLAKHSNDLKTKQVQSHFLVFTELCTLVIKHPGTTVVCCQFVAQKYGGANWLHHYFHGFPTIFYNTNEPCFDFIWLLKTLLYAKSLKHNKHLNSFSKPCFAALWPRKCAASRNPLPQNVQWWLNCDWCTVL